MSKFLLYFALFGLFCSTSLAPDPTYDPTNAPTNVPSSSTNAPTHAPTNAPTNAPSDMTTTTTETPTYSPSNSPTKPPTATPTHSSTSTTTYIPFTSHGPDIDVRYQLAVNFTLNFTSETVEPQSTRTITIALVYAYSKCGIAANYIHIKTSEFKHNDIIPSNRLYCIKVFTAIDSPDYQTTMDYETMIESDPDDTSQFCITRALYQTLPAEWIDISHFFIDPKKVKSSGSDSNDTTKIILWFLGVSAVCAVCALVLIIFWRKCYAKDDSIESDNAINLDFLLDPNETMESIDPNTVMKLDGDNSNEHTLQYTDDMILGQNSEKKQKKKKEKYFSRLDDGDDNAIDADVDDSDEFESPSDHDDDEYNADVLDDHYDPPQFARID